MSYPFLRCYSWWVLKGSWKKWLYSRGSKEKILGLKGGHGKIFFKFCSDSICNNANSLPDCQNPVFVLSLFLSFRRLEVVGEREKRRARRRQAPSPLAVSHSCAPVFLAYYFQAPATQAMALWFAARPFPFPRFNLKTLNVNDHLQVIWLIFQQWTCHILLRPPS